MGLSRMVSIALIGLMAAGVSSTGRLWSLTLALVMSDKGVPGTVGSGDADGLGVGIAGGMSAVAGLADLGATLLRFLGEGFFGAVSSSAGAMAVWSGSRTSVGSMPADAWIFLGRPGLRGVVGASVMVFLLPAVDRRGLRAGAGVKSSSLSSAIRCVASATSSSESMTAVRRDATRRDERVAMVGREAATLRKKIEAMDTV